MDLWEKLCWNATPVVYEMCLFLDSSQLKQTLLLSCFVVNPVLLSPH